MLLKRVVMCGFKSFADRVDLDFGRGVTCIVGPNGCGKSNVVDAVKWVLGEQSAKSLRGRQMADMIFNGSSTRRSSGVSEVELSFDNTDRSLALDVDEITVTRKLYRSGESEYLLNRGIARLKDIRELFLDTGIGVDAYSVIEQGRVDQLLQSSPVDRRIIFEEAAGISKYKVRKHEAQRKLERTEQNLLRVADIIEELEKRLRSVKLQAGKARSFQEHQARLNELRSSFAMAEYHRFTGQIRQLTGEAESLSDQATALRTDIDRHEASSSQAAIQMDALAVDIGQADNKLVQLKADLAGQMERMEAARRRESEQSEQRQRILERKAGDTARLTASREEVERVGQSARSVQEQADELHRALEGLHQDDHRLARELTEAQAILEDEKAGIIELLRKSAQTHNEIIRLSTQRESLVGQKGRLSQRDAQIRSELENALERKAQFGQRLGEIDSLITEETQALDEKKAEALRVNAVRQGLIDELAATKERRTALQSRKGLLEDLQRAQEGVGTGVRHLLGEKAKENGPVHLRSLVGMVAEIFETDIAHAAIIEAALAGCDQNVFVTDSRAFLARPKEFDHLPGRISAICEDRLPPVLNPREFMGQSGYVGRAIELVRYDDRYQRLAQHLFEKTIVVESLADAVKLSQLDVEGHRFVTLRGEVVEPDGRVSVGPPASETGIISRRSELREIESQLIELDRLVERLADQLDRTQAEAGHLEAVQQELRTAIYESSTAKVEAQAGLANLQEAINRLTSEQPLIAQEVALLEHQINEVLEQSSVGGRSLEEMEGENRRREQLVADQQSRIDEIVAGRHGVQEQMTQAKVAMGQVIEKRAALAETMSGLNRTMVELDNAVAQAEGDLRQCEARIAEARQTLASGAERQIELNKEIGRLDEESARLREAREKTRCDLELLGHSIRAARSRLAEIEARLHEQQMQLTQVSVRRDDLVARVVDELGVNLSERYQQYEYQEQDWEQVETEIADLRLKIERLGNVNLDAIGELAELEQRHGFLTGQRDDLSEAQRQLMQLIETLNRESKERFLKAFEEIRENFRALFRKLFGGGRADIILEDPESTLDCGIEIVAQPPGKELRTITLMSGGEKSLTAIALLMSIFKTRPAPFVILDEVDAALDEANNDRFNRIVQEFVRDTQFVIITHSKRTMGIADRLFGITMQEPGVSTRVSVQLGEASVA